MTHELDKIELCIKLQGSLDEWEGWKFNNGSYCGKAQDSVGVSFQGHVMERKKFETVLAGGVFTREDVIKLRDFLTVCIGSWTVPPTPLLGLLRKSAGLPELPEPKK